MLTKRAFVFVEAVLAQIMPGSTDAETVVAPDMISRGITDIKVENVIGKSTSQYLSVVFTPAATPPWTYLPTARKDTGSLAL